MAVGAFGNQFTYPGQFTPWSGAQQGIQGLGVNPYAFQQYTQNQPLISAPLTSTIGGHESLCRQEGLNSEAVCADP